MNHPISFVGAGPGAPDLLTLRASERIRHADVLIWTDSLVSPEITALAKDDCLQVRTSRLTLEEVVPQLIAHHKAGRHVVRLHDGDTALYSAINEQICALNDENIPVEVVPGISAYQAAAAGLCSELTTPGLVQTIVLSRARGRTGIPEREQLHHLASLRASLCLYLSARHVEEVQSTLLEHYPSDTPVAVGYRVGWPDQLLEVVPLHEMVEFTQRHELIRTTLYVISPALRRNSSRSRLYSPDHDHLFRPKR